MIPLSMHSLVLCIRTLIGLICRWQRAGGALQKELKIPLSGASADGGGSVLGLYHLLQADPHASSQGSQPGAAAAAAYAEREASGALGFSDLSQFERHRCDCVEFRAAQRRLQQFDRSQELVRG